MKRLLPRSRSAHAAGVWPLHPATAETTFAEAPRGLGTEATTGRRFRVLAVVTVVCIFALISLGGVVRLTDSGLGCPDWPLCHGKVIPPMEASTLIEYSHRLVASVVGILIVAIAFIIWRFYRDQAALTVPASVGVVLLVVQVLLGGFTVLGELPAELVLAHLATAEALMAAMVVVCLAALGWPLAARDGPGNGRERDRFPMLTLVAGLGAYGLLLTGSYVTVSEATSACGQSWPLCNGQLLPDVTLSITHMAHRFVALLVGVVMLVVLGMAWRRRANRPGLGSVSAIVTSLFMVQVLIGALTLWLGFPLATRLLHLMLATLVWVGLIVLSVLVFVPAERFPKGEVHA